MEEQEQRQPVTPAEDAEAQLMLFAEATSALLASPKTPDVLRTIVGLASKFGSADGYAVWRKSPNNPRWTLVSSTGLSDEFVRSGLTQDEGLALTQPLVFEDVVHEPLLSSRRGELQREGIRSMLVAPLQVHGEAIGTVTLYWKSPHQFTDSEVRMSVALSNMAAGALATAELYERETELRTQAETAEKKAAFLAEASAVFSNSLDYETTLRSVARLSIERFADWCAVDVNRGGKLERVTVEHVDPAKVQLAEEYRRKYPPREDDVTSVAFRTGQAVLVEEMPHDSLLDQIGDPEQVRLIRLLGIESIMITPMVHRGRSLGLLTFVSSRRDQLYTKADLALAQQLASRAAVAIDNAQLYADVRASEARYRSLVSATTSLVWNADPYGRFVHPQPSWEAYTGQSWEAHCGFGWLAAVCPEDVRKVKKEWLRAIREQATFEIEGRLWNAETASYHFCCVRGLPVKGGNDCVSEWVGTVTDIHARKCAEEERSSLLAREQQARFTAELLNRVGRVLSADLDPQSLAKSITDLATKLVNAEFGALFHNVVNENGDAYMLYTLSGAVKEDFEKFPMPRNTGLFGPTFRGEGVVRSDDVTRDPRYGQNPPFNGMPKGHLPVRSYLAVPIVSRSGEVLGALLFGHSQTGIFGEQAEQFAVGIASQAAIALDNARLFKQAQEGQAALRRSNDELRRANDDLNQFAYSASHDLQEPLRMVSAFTQLLRKRYREQLDPQADQYIDYAVRGAQHMEELLRDLLAYTQATSLSGGDAGPSDATAALNKALSNIQQAIDRSGARIQADPLPVLAAAEIHVVQLFQNLVGNAIKYAGDHVPEVRLTAAPIPEGWRFSVRDNGIGIDPKYKDQIFGLFKRLHTSAHFQGTGIGLAICQKICERYGGKIWVESELGEGATFYFTLPDRDSRQLQ
jgi:PAS domain S-box-containing protein